MDDLTLAQDKDFLTHLEDDGRRQLLREHLLSFGQVGIGTAGAGIGLLHNLGKYSRDFQQYLRCMALDQDTEQV